LEEARLIRFPNAFAEDGEWLKVQLHSHTTESDGELSPDWVVDHYAHVGFDVLVITDHWTVTKLPDRSDILLIPGAELAVDPLNGPMIPEFLAIGIDELPEDPGGDRSVWYPYPPVMYKTFPSFEAGAAYVAEQGGVSFLCHPFWSGLPEADVLAASAMRGMEVFNTSAERENERGDSSYVWDRALDSGIAFTALATDDSHYPGFDVGDGWTMVKAPERTREGVLHGLREGLSYASAGPTIRDVQIDGRAYEVSCSPAAGVTLHGHWEQGWGVTADHRGRQEFVKILERDDAGLILRARATIPDDVDPLYARVVITDARGRKAYANPM
jgi:hypothetical protein